MSRLELAGDSVRAALEEIAQTDPDWLAPLIEPGWAKRYGRLVNSLKGVSSRRLRQKFPDLVHRFWRANKLWSSSYFTGTVGGAPLPVVRPYVEQQNQPV
ncbi:transposase [Streptomyces sp. NPDC001286]